MAGHPAEFEYDWRTRFRSPLSVVGRSMPWGEAIRLTSLLIRDPSSQVAAALMGWPYPMGRDTFAVLDLYDLVHAVAAGKKRPPPHPMRPQVSRRKERLGAKQTLSQDEVIAALRNAGHTAPLPTR